MLQIISGGGARSSSAAGHDGASRGLILLDAEWNAYTDPFILQDEYHEKCDFFSFCCVSFEVLSGERLPQLKLKELLTSKQNRRPVFPDWISDRLRTVLLSGFEEDISKRADWEETTPALSE